MKKLFIPVLALILISEFLFAEGYVGLTDYDVKRFIVLVNELEQEGKKDNSELNGEFLQQKYESESFTQNGKLDVLLDGLVLAGFILTYSNSSELMQLENAGIDFFSLTLKRAGIDFRDVAVMTRHKKDFINAAALLLW